MTAPPAASVTALLPHDTREGLRRARGYMDSRFAEPLKLTQIAAHAGFSRYHFARLFRRAYRLSPHAYLTRRRIEQAKALLMSEHTTVTDVCLAVGFQSPSTFSTLFRQHTGLTPREYQLRWQRRRRYHHQVMPGCFVVMYVPKQHCGGTT